MGRREPGKWTFRGSLSLRELPTEDATIDALDSDARVLLARRWAARARAELSASAVLAMVAREVLGEPSTAELHWLASRATSDKVRHAEICRRVASHYRGRAVSWPAPTRAVEPKFGELPPGLSRSLHVVLACCVNQTIANAVLFASRERAQAPLCRAALRELLVDVVEHARIGWLYLATPTVRERVQRPLEAALPLLLRLARDGWLRRAGHRSAAPPGHGVLPGADLRRVVDDCVKGVIVPAFNRLGVETSNVSPWSG